MKLCYDYVKNYFNHHGCELLETEYVHSKTLMKYVCVCKNVAQINFNNFQQGKRCQNCLRIKRSGSNNYQWKQNREQHKIELQFKDKCHKSLTAALKISGNRKSGQRTKDLLGYDWRDLKEHIENHPNYPNIKDGNWHLDHIFPIKAFLDHNIWDVKVINALDNLQPLLAEENCSKSDSYDVERFAQYLKDRPVSQSRNWINLKSKLTYNDVEHIRKLRKQGLTLKEIAMKYDVHTSTIGLICKNKTWRKT